MQDNTISLDQLRSEIDKLDREWLTILAKRFEVTTKVGIYKAQNHLPPIDKSREAAQAERIGNLAVELGVDPELAKSILATIIAKVVDDHKSIRLKFESQSGI